MPKAKKATQSQPETVKEPVLNSVPADEVLPETVAPAKTSYDVYNFSGSLVRTYTGENAEANAKEYASKIGGSFR